MSTIKYLDEDGLLYVKQKLDTEFGKKVDKENGKGLSTNDYTTAEKNKLGAIASGAQVNVIEEVQVNGTALVPSSKSVNVVCGTYSKPSGGIPSTDLSSAVQTSLGKADSAIQDISGKADKATTLSGYGITNAYTKTETDSAISTAIGGIIGISFEIVTTLPASGETGVIYLISNSGSGQNIYDEYIWVNNAFEKIGTTAVDLSGYVQFTDLVAITNAEIDTIFGAVSL